MRLGLNQNIVSKDKTYHVQTEDGGVKNPFVTSIVFMDGRVLASKKTSYADILKSPMLDKIVKELMEEQHNSLVKAIREGRLWGRKPAESASAPVEIQPPPSREEPAFTEDFINAFVLRELSLKE
jgi:hypothetical protein